MAAKYFAVLILASLLTQGLQSALPDARSFVEITLPDVHTTFITNNLIGKTLSIPKLFIDTLVSCHVIYPTGIMYEAYPNNQIPEGHISYLSAVPPFNGCGIGFLGAPVSYSGTYELVSIVIHNWENYTSLTRQKFHLTLVESNPN